MQRGSDWPFILIEMPSVSKQVNTTIKSELKKWYIATAATRFKENVAYLRMLPQETKQVCTP